ncbi:MAG: alpha/beta hydrolase [Fidelibacterota bacterium]
MIDIPPAQPPAKGTVLVLHGWGANSADVEPLARSLRLPRMRYVIPEARVEVPGTGGVGKGWFTFPVSERSEEERQESIRQVFDLLDTLSESGSPPERTVLMGFSQGASLCLDVAFAYAQPVAGIVSLSGFVIDAGKIREADSDGLPLQVPIFAGQGRLDAIVPLEMGKSSFIALREKGFKVEWHEYDSGHHVVVEELEDVRSFLTRLFS